jgi:hypothetical protein
MDYYLDASALVKRYTTEPGSEWVVEITDPAADPIIMLSEITLVEVTAALAAKQRAPYGFTLAECDRAISRFLQDCAEMFILLQVDRKVIDQAVGLARAHRLRGYDAVQLATALVTNRDLTEHDHPPLIFIASDDDLLAAAQVRGIATDNPLNYLPLSE